ncbi:hypothetical protein MED121_22787 [Marinomonas sp. MED121]|uniref:formate dehydrogenase subunit delta n=1 Tax=Marinomonas sp. MED121 TaxID=314277 RepID=UPI000068FDB7|nr:formate dehydrogenase subunit delta [Marinomonas sp. MED121]EAQ65547.1 hypothetical protein MED121_22787 [Marinomonas sp. MED121]
MSENELSHLIKMANQIASNIGIGSTEEDCVKKVVTHITAFWALPMRQKICANMEEFAEDLNPIATKALLEIQTNLKAA